jgi:major membrane immunogen (membrane-anchored lipoprotein)
LDDELALTLSSQVGNLLAVNSSMTDKKNGTQGKNNENEEESRELFEAVANEPDPQRLSELIDQLIRMLDSRRVRAFAAATGENQSEEGSGC